MTTLALQADDTEDSMLRFPYEAQRQLICSLIERAWLDLYLIDHSQDARRYIKSQMFEHDCQLIGLDPSYLRKRIFPNDDTDQIQPAL